MDRFRKRTYRGVRSFWQDAQFLFARRKQVRGGLVSPAFRERLMLAVTGVNECHYCTWFHARTAPLTGVTAEEQAMLLGGEVQQCPAEEIPALLFARYWAECDANPAPEVRAQLVEIYGAEQASAIELVLRTIRAGNLLGNTADYVLYRLSFGRLGIHEAHRARA